MKTWVVDYIEDNKLFSINIFAPTEDEALRLAKEWGIENPEIKGELIESQIYEK